MRWWGSKVGERKEEGGGKGRRQGSDQTEVRDPVGFLFDVPDLKGSSYPLTFEHQSFHRPTTFTSSSGERAQELSLME